MNKFNVLLVALILFPVTLFAGDFETIVKANFVKMQIFENGEKTSSNMVVDLFVFKYHGELRAVWNHVFIMPDDTSKIEKTVLRADHYTTDTGGIENLRVEDDGVVSFYLNRSSDRKVKIICMEIEDKKYEIKGVSNYWSSLLKKNFVEEWSVTEKIMLPSLEVY